MNHDIRWKQWLDIFSKALRQLTAFIEKGELNELEWQGLIHSFECTYELAWNTIKDFFEAQGETDILGSCDAFRLAFQRGLIENGEVWMEMIKSRALSRHAYNEDIAQAIVHSVVSAYYGEFVRLHDRLEALGSQAP